ncbi:MAG: glycosyltransferase family 4 protein [Lachnospiraceae bacterium]|nr:glycosyltransferase family 4 protein [Lachnospiraceae bacterium]
MNIIFASTAYIEPGRVATGLPNYLRHISHSLAKMGHDVTIVYSANYNQIRNENGVEVIAVHVPRLTADDELETSRVRGVADAYYINRKIEEMMRDRLFDIIQFSSLEGIGRLYRKDVPAVMRLSSYHKTYFASGITICAELRDARAEEERKAARGMDGVFAPCQITAQAFSMDTGIDVDIIESPFENDVQEMDKTVYEERISGRKYFLFFGTLYAEKGILIIAKTLHDFLGKHEDYYFVAAGDVTNIGGIGADKILLDGAGEFAERVIILPALPHKCLYPVIEGAEFVVLPSLMDNLPNACIEAMYFGKIVIGTDGASFEQLIDDEKNGFLCGIGDAVSLLNKMEKVATLDAITKKRMEKLAHQRITKLDSEKVAQNLIEYYKDIIANKGNNKAYREEADQAYKSAEKFINDRLNEIKKAYMEEADKRFLQSRVLLRWVDILRKGSDYKGFFSKREYKSIVIYGVYDIGKMLIEDLINNGLNVVYAIDRIHRNTCVKIYTPDSELPDADVMVVTPISSFQEIKSSLSRRFKGSIVSLEDVLFDE